MLNPFYINYIVKHIIKARKLGDHYSFEFDCFIRKKGKITQAVLLPILDIDCTKSFLKLVTLMNLI